MPPPISGGLSAEQLELLEVEMRKSEGKIYDGRFQWNDNAIYCSEFIYDSFNNGLQITVGAVQTFGEFPLDGPEARKLIKDRYTDEGFLSASTSRSLRRSRSWMIRNWKPS